MAGWGMGGNGNGSDQLMFHMKVIISEMSLNGGETFPEANSGNKRCKMEERKNILNVKGKTSSLKCMEVALFIKCSGNNIQLSVSRTYRVPGKDENEKVG